jgi:iron complex outermembrane receptor protein
MAADPPAAPPAADLANLSFEELANVKVATVYGASKHEQTVAEAPSDVTIVTAQDIKQFGYRTLGEILNGVRGFYTVSDGVYDYLGTRGFHRPGDYGGRILITLDGHRMNDDIFDSSPVGTEFLLDVDLIERVEVIRGPGSSLYGDNAVFAVINIITRKGRDANGTELVASYGSYNEGTGRVTFGNRFTNGIEMLASVSFLGRDGNNDRYYQAFANINHGHAVDNQSASVPQAFGTLSYKDISIEGGISQRTEIAPTGPYYTTFNDVKDKVVDQRGFLELKLEHHFDDDLQLMGRVYYDHYRYNGNYPLAEYSPGDPRYPGAITLNLDRDDQESAGAEIQVRKTLFERHRLTAGTEYRHDFILDQKNYDVGGVSYLNSNPTEDTVGVYVQDEYTICHKLLLNAGARFDYFSSFGNTFNPRAALIYTPWTNSTFKAIYGQAFRAPDAFEQYYEAPGYLADTRLKPETIRSYELDYDQTISRHFQLVSSVFYYQINHLITFGTDPSGDSVFGNLAGATSTGGEIELDATWAKGWKGKASYTYADARDSSTSQRLSDSPKHVGKLALSAPVWHDKVSANLEVLALSDRETIQGNNLPPYWVANFNLFSHDIIKNLEFSAGVYNLFDRKYQDPVGSDFPQASVQQNGRSFRAKISYKF